MSINSSSDHGQAFSKLVQPEKQNLLLLSEDRSNQEIAKAVFLGEGTIRNYINSILKKLRVNNRDEVTAYALKHNLRGHMGYKD